MVAIQMSEGIHVFLEILMGLYRRANHIWIIVMIAFWFAGCACLRQQTVDERVVDERVVDEGVDKRFAYPTSSSEPVVDQMHGVEIADPFRWLENDDSPRVVEWTQAQNHFTAAYLENVSGSSWLRDALQEAFKVGWLAKARVVGNKVFWVERRGEAEQPSLMVRELSENAPRTLLDINTLSDDGTVALDWFHPSPSGAYVAYGLSRHGDEKSVLHLLRTVDASPLKDKIEGARHASLSWLMDESGFFYTRYPIADTRYWPELTGDEGHYHRQIYLHQLESDPAQDLRIFGSDLAAEDWPNIDATPDGTHLVATVSRGWSNSTVYVRQAENPDETSWVKVAARPETRDEAIPSNQYLFLFTNHEAPMGKVERLSWDDLDITHGETIVPERPDRVMRDVMLVANHLVIHWLEDASSRVTIHNLDGDEIRKVPLPALGTVNGLAGDPEHGDLFYTFSSFAIAPRLIRTPIEASDLTTDQVWIEIPAPNQPSDFDVRLERTSSRDGTPVTFFITHRRGIKRNGKNPTVLYGYGGFNHSLTPSYTRNTLPFLSAGGVYVVAHLRGGGEYGEAWHRDGMLGNKHKVFEDFEAIAEHLVKVGYTSPQRLAVMGGSNGGLLTGAATVRFPEKFRAAVVRVPLLDMLRYHHFLVARLWIPEYGSSDDPEAFKWLYAYSPYHHVPEDFRNPAGMLLAAESDSRVAPLHARKFAALLQTRSASPHPILLRMETKAGHGAGKPRSKQVDEYLDIWKFIWHELKAPIPK
jgi:prolyl oligopeptidase